MAVVVLPPFMLYSVYSDLGLYSQADARYKSSVTYEGLSRRCFSLHIVVVDISEHVVYPSCGGCWAGRSRKQENALSCNQAFRILGRWHDGVLRNSPVLEDSLVAL